MLLTQHIYTVCGLFRLYTVAAFAVPVLFISKHERGLTESFEDENVNHVIINYHELWLINKSSSAMREVIIYFTLLYDA